MGNRRWRTLCHLAWAAVVLALSVGCGPIEYVNQVTRKASASVDAAKVAGADKYSPYYYTLAKEYLHKAREEAAAADFEAANRFGRSAEKAADMAKQEAIDRAGKPIEQFHPVVVPPAGGSARTTPTETTAPLDTGDDDDDADSGGDDDGGMAPLDPGDDDSSADDDETPPGMGDAP